MLRNLVQKFKNYLKKREEEGQSLVEYGLILALVSVVAISILTVLGTQINDTVSKITNTLSGVQNNINTSGNQGL